MYESLIEILLADNEGISGEIKDSDKYLKNEKNIEKLLRKALPDMPTNDFQDLLWNIGIAHSYMEEEKINAYFKLGIKFALRLLIETDVCAFK